MQKIAVIDNYDSFTYNLVHYIEGILDADVAVFRNDAVSLATLADYDKILLSPGPGLPHEAGLLMPIIETYCRQKNILGVCLGLQAIVMTYGGTLYNLPTAFHGVATDILQTTPYEENYTEPLFLHIPPVFKAARYHSWVADRDTLPNCLRITCTDPNGYIMGVAHKQHKVQGVQFHPEAILSEYGYLLLKNWVCQDNG